MRPRSYGVNCGVVKAKDEALLRRAAEALRSQGDEHSADQLDAAVEDSAEDGASGSLHDEAVREAEARARREMPKPGPGGLSAGA